MKKKLAKKGIDGFAIRLFLIILSLSIALCFSSCGTKKLISKESTIIQTSNDTSKNVEVKDRTIEIPKATVGTSIDLADIPTLQKVITVDRPIIVKDSTGQAEASYWFDKFNKLQFSFTSKPLPITVHDTVSTVKIKQAKDVYHDKIVKETTYRLSFKLLIITIIATLIFSILILQYTSIGRFVLGIFTKIFSIVMSIFSKK